MYRSSTRGLSTVMWVFFFFSSRRRHTRSDRDWSSDVCSSDLIDKADSWATDGHKWLQTPYDCGYAIVRDEAAHRRAMTIAASYLPPAEEGERDPTDRKSVV